MSELKLSLEIHPLVKPLPAGVKVKQQDGHEVGWITLQAFRAMQAEMDALEAAYSSPNTEMSTTKTARGVLAEHVSFLKDVEGESAAAHCLPDDIIEALDAAGFVIVPKEPTETQTDAGAKAGAFTDHAQQMSVEVHEQSSRDVASEVYRAMIAAAGKSAA